MRGAPGLSRCGVKDTITALLIKQNNYSLVLLQTNHDSSDLFRIYITSGKISETGIKTASDQRLIDAMKDCETFVREWPEKTGRPVIDLLATIWNRLSVIYHEINDEATVYRVFEVLNSRGLARQAEKPVDGGAV